MQVDENIHKFLKEKLSGEHYEKLIALKNPKLHKFVADAVELCNPSSIFLCTDSAEDIQYMRNQAIVAGEENQLATEGHTIHYDGYNDQARDKANTKYLLPKGVDLGANLNSVDKEEGLVEVRGFLKNSVNGKEMLIRFFCLGPTNSKFSISGVQITDSFYVAHSEDLLYRSGYEQFKLLGDSEEFFRVLHSAGSLENYVSADVDKRRVYIDLKEEIVYSVNTQYAGNTVGFKKLSLRLAISKANREGWLAEHMFVMGVNGAAGRKTYFTGAFPSACGKTSTAMLPGESIIGDDIAYLRVIDGEVRTVNVECGIFGIIRDVNPIDDPVIYNALHTPGEIIFSNVLIKDDRPYWLGMGCDLPTEGVNHSGQWQAGKKDAAGKAIDPSHKNARYTVRISALENQDECAEDPAGVVVSGIIYGGRDSDTMPPVVQSFDWAHGVVLGASLESETTSATLGQEGVRSFQPMSNLDFVAIPLGKYIQNHLEFVKGLKRKPLIFAINYFLKGKKGEYLNGMLDKKIWIRWMELRVNGDVEAIESPLGLIPLYKDLASLFKELLDQDYTEEQYIEQFSIRVPENLAKLDRIERIYRTDVTDTPSIFFDILRQQRERLQETKEKYGNYISPLRFIDQVAG